MTISKLSRIRFNNWFIQVRPTQNIENEFIGWTSLQPSDDPMIAKGGVYFDFGTTKNEVIDKLKAEINML